MIEDQKVNDSKIPTAACKRKKEDLDLLGATYDTQSVTTFKFSKPLDIPLQLQNSITRIAESSEYSHR
jgi:hypothetical protein